MAREEVELDYLGKYHILIALSCSLIHAGAEQDWVFPLSGLSLTANSAIYRVPPARRPCRDVLVHIQLTQWSAVLPVKLTVTQLAKKSPAFYATRIFVAVFTKSLHLLKS